MIHIVGTLADVSEHNFDLILANLYGDLLLQLAEELAARARSGALLLLSGMLWEYNFEVRRTFERFGCSEIENHMLPEFSTALLRMG